MFKKILVPLDGSPLAEAILTRLHRGLASEVEVRLLTVIPAAKDHESGWHLQAFEKAREYLRGVRDSLAASGIRADFEIRSGEAAEQILEFARTWRPSLVAMSTHGRSGLSRAVRGSVAERVLRRSRHPLLLASPRGLEPGRPSEDARFRKVLVPLDGSAASARIVPLVRTLAKGHQSEVVLQYVDAACPIPASGSTFFFTEPPVEIDSVLGSGERVAKEVLEPHRETLARDGIACRIRIDRNVPAAAILEAAAAEKADLVAMTTHGRSGISRWVYGSVAEGVVRRAPVPLLIQRTGGLGAEPAGERRRQKKARA